MRRIWLKGKYAVVSNCDYAFASQWKWQALRRRTITHVTRRQWKNGVAKTVYLHQLIAERMGLTIRKKAIDHADRNGLNNQRLNLRVATKSQNGMNRGPQSNSRSRIKGVSWDKSRGKWRASIKVLGRQKLLGRFTNKTIATKAYNKAAKKYFGKFAYQNPL